MKKLLLSAVVLLSILSTNAYAVFPSTPILDTGIRANGAIGANWTNYFCDGLRIISNSIAMNTGGGCGETGDYWNVTTNYLNLEAYVTITTLANAALYFRANSDATLGYLISYESGSIIIYRLSDFAVLATYPTTGLASGDAFGVRMVGTSIQGFKRVSGSWTALGVPVVDTTVTAAGRIGIYLSNTTVRLNNFGGGTYIGSGFFNLM